MKAAIKMYKNDGEKENGFPVKIILSHLRKTRRKTLSYSKLSDWDPLLQHPLPSHDDFDALYPLILEIRKKAIKLEFRQMEDFEDAFDYLQGKVKVVSSNFYTYASSRIENMILHNRHGNARAYTDAKKALEEFAPNLKFKDITPYFLEQYKEFQKAKGNKNSTIVKNLVEIRAMYNSAVKAGVTEDKKPFTGLFTDIPVRKRRARNRYLSPEDILQLETAYFNREALQRAVDLSLLQFYLCGADLVDVYYLKNENIIKDRVILTRRKLGNKAYEFDVLLPEKAKILIDKYRQEGEYVFPWRKDYKGYRTFIRNHNDDLKEVKAALKIELEPKDDSLTTKVMRHTFATLGKFARIEEDLLRELMGHERNEMDTVYKDKYPEAERDAAQLKILGVLAEKKKVRNVSVKLKVKRG